MDSDLMRWVKAQADDPNANPRFRELLAALEAAREDAERWRKHLIDAVAQQPDAGVDVEAVLRQFLTGDGFIAECDIQHIVAALSQPAEQRADAMLKAGEASND